MMRRLFLFVLSVSLLSVPSVQAASIFLPDPLQNNLFAVAFDPGGPPMADSVLADLLGSAAGNIVDSVTLTNMGQATVLVNETDNSVDLATLDAGQLNIVFDFTSALFTEDGFLQFSGIGSPIVNSPNASGFVGQVLATFSFVQGFPIEEPAGNVNQYVLVNIAGPDSTATPIPEPASLTLVGLGIAGAAARRRRMQNKS